MLVRANISAIRTSFATDITRIFEAQGRSRWRYFLSLVLGQIVRAFSTDVYIYSVGAAYFAAARFQQLFRSQCTRGRRRAPLHTRYFNFSQRGSLLVEFTVYRLFAQLHTAIHQLNRLHVECLRDSGEVVR
jgi:hypothetical protein